MDARNRNELWATALLDELSRAGVREIVVAPGSRSAPLVLAAAGDDRFRVTLQVDERSAGFLALGVGKASGVPAAVITTSGTAAANLLPAVVESAQSESPLLLLTADRPPRLRGADANQAIDQIHLFGRYVRLFQELSPAELSTATLRHLRSVAARAVAVATGDPAGPVHLNLPFEKPLEPTLVPGDVPEALLNPGLLGPRGRPGAVPFTRIPRRRARPDPEGLDVLADRLRRASRPLLVAGPVPRPWETAVPIRELAARGFPLLADPLSGARFGLTDPARFGAAAPEAAALPGGYDLALRWPEVRRELRPDLIVRFGATPTSSGVEALLAEGSEVPQLVVDGGDRWKDHLAAASHVLPWDPALTASELAARLAGEGRDGAHAARSAWLTRWRELGAAVEAVVEGPDGCGGTFFEGTILREVAARTPEDALLFVSSSMPVRDVDAYGVPRHGGPLVLGNRGASGIDGIVSTAIGASLATGRTVVAVLGDLALLHDLNGLLAAREEGVRVIFVVVQNDGGGIFHLLPIRRFDPPFTRLFATPHGREVDRIAALHDLPHLAVEGRSEPNQGPGEDRGMRGGRPEGAAGLREALDRALTMEGSVLLEVRTDRDENERRHREVAECVRSALGAAWSPGER
jgi:2-succinyl-5-enolpyruvyl-6-hydroxy-3-cyclohexene-1-carboxylate synthase